MARGHKRARLAGLLLMTLLLLGAIGYLLASRILKNSPARAATSALIYGTNLSLYDTNDQVVDSPTARRLLKQVHMPIIRMPFRFSLSDAYEVQALRAIQDIGAIPLIILHGPIDPNALNDDRHLLALAQGVFGNHTVYVEYGNEADLAGFDVWRYTASWNVVVPVLKAMAPTYKFVGPVTFQPDPAYIATFDKYADPRPDANSWHEYVCYPNSSDAYCLAHLADWTTDIQQTNAAVRAAIGTTLPIMITEWNLDAAPDARYMSSDFMRTWTARALQTLAANVPDGMMAAMQYCVTNNPNFSLIDGSNIPTAEGQTLFQMLASAG
jgi:hypothetical protein